MKKILICLLIISCQFSIYGQDEIKKKKRSFDPYTLEYHVLKDNKKVKHGSFKRFYTHKKIILAEGNYYKDKKSGIWSYYNTLGEKIISYDFSDKKVIEWNNEIARNIKYYEKHFIKTTDSERYISYNMYKALDFLILDKTYPIIELLDSETDNLEMIPPIFVEGDEVFQDILLVNFFNSISSFELTRNSLISLEIDSLGNTVEINIETSNGENFEQEFVKKLYQANLKWIPAHIKNKPTRVKYYIPVKSFFEKTENGNKVNLVFHSNSDFRKNEQFKDKEILHSWVKSIN